MPDDTKTTTELRPPAQNPNNIEAKKYYIFNETGNIMMASTVDTSQPLQESVRGIFEEVSVFYAAMTKAITETTNPVTQQPYSIYNYNALEKIIGGSGLFVQVTEEDVLHKTESFGANFSKELIESLLGLATGAGALGFASAMISSIGKEGLRISASKDQTESKVGNIVFVCEYLLGMPMVSAIVVYADCKQHVTQFQAGPCIKASSVSTEWILHKDTYFFVTPKFIHKFAVDLGSIRADPNYQALSDWFQELLTGTPGVFGVFEYVDTKTGWKETPFGSALDPAKSYKLVGEFLPTKKGVLKFAEDGSGKITAGNWGPGEIGFTVKDNQDTAAAIEVYSAEDKLVASTLGTYTIKKQRPEPTPSPTPQPVPVSPN